MAGADVVLILTPISLATMLASVVLPKPGGPCKIRCSKLSSRFCAASINIDKFFALFPDQ